MVDDRRPQAPLAEVFDEVELLIALVELRDLTVLAVSRMLASRLDSPAAALVGRSVLELMAPEDRPKSRAALDALGAHVVDFYRAHRPLAAATGPVGLATEWVRAIEFDGERRALVEFGDGCAPRLSPLSALIGREPEALVVGMVDDGWTVTAVSADVEQLLGLAPPDLVGRRLVGAIDERDVPRLLDAGRRATGDCSVALRLHLRTGAGGWARACCVLGAVTGAAVRFFILLPDPDVEPGGPRAVVADHLRRVAAEVDATGRLQRLGATPELAHLPHLGSLTARQWEVLDRLLAGERVPTIADELFISASTVRNHLSAVFEVFGVHSQAELLAALRGRASRG